MSGKTILVEIEAGQLAILRAFGREMLGLITEREKEISDLEAWKAEFWTPEIKAARLEEVRKYERKKCGCGRSHPKGTELRIAFEQDHMKAWSQSRSQDGKIGHTALHMLDSGLIEAFTHLCSDEVSG